ncbi:MAG: hypothetical protein IJC07_03205 [Clostridia bacterium]|nr:hypothetical protein [Clostridia bacterium]
MYFYFSASVLSAIKLDGIYYGIIHDNVKHINVQDDRPVFVEVCPLNAKSGQINFLLDQDFLSHPPDNVWVVNLRGGYLIKFALPQDDSPFCLLSQEKAQNLLVTAYKENGLKISIETPTDFCLEQFSLCVDSAKIYTFSLSGEQFVGITFFGKDNYSAVYKVGGKIEKLLFLPATLFLENNLLKTEQNFLDMAKHKVIVTWEYLGGKLVESNRSVSAKKSLNVGVLPQKLVPYAFLEELLAGGNVADFTCGKVKENAYKLKNYLGDFIGVFPPPVFRSAEEVGIVLPSDCGYKVDYLTFEFEGNKICNIKKSAE